MRLSRLFSKNFSKALLLLCLGVTLALKSHAGTSSDNDVDLQSSVEQSTPSLEQESRPQISEQLAEQIRLSEERQNATDRASLQKEIHVLMLEKARIERQKASVLESLAQRTFWIQCLIGFLALMMLGSLLVFWRFYSAERFQHGLSEIGNTLKQFHDSLFSFTDTHQLLPESTIPPFFSHNTKTENAGNIGAITKMPGIIPKQEHAETTSGKPLGFGLEPGTGIGLNNGKQDELTGVKGFVDAWLRVYKPGDSYVDQVAEINAKQAKTPVGLLHKIDVHRNANDRASYDSVRKEIKKLFNISVKPWHAMANVETSELKDFPHVIDKILQLWPSNEIELYLERLLKNSRVGPRKGFDPKVYEKIESLLTLAKNPKRPRQLHELREIHEAAFLFVPIERKVSHNSIEPMTEQAQALVMEPVARLEKASVAAETPIATRPVVVAAKTTPTSSVTVKPVEAISKVSAAMPILSPIAQTKPSIPDHRTNAQSEEKFLLSPYEVRLKLAVAYLEIGDSEGACLLLEDVIRDAPEDQKQHAQRLLLSIEEKQVRYCGNSEEIYFN